MAPRPLPFVVATVAIVSVVAFAGLVAAASHPAVPAGFLPEGMTSAPSGLRDSQTTSALRAPPTTVSTFLWKYNTTRAGICALRRLHRSLRRRDPRSD